MTIVPFSWSYRKFVFVGSLVAMVMLAFATKLSMQSFPSSLEELVVVSSKKTYVDRYGLPLNKTYENRWNLYERLQIHEVPEFLQKALVLSEDKRFFSHSGIDWLARINALRQNLLAAKTVRGASTITEQVVRMIHSRPRTIWSRWVEGFEAMFLEWHFSKLEILEFYLNQVPYKAKRRGVAQAAHYYFDRDIQTLNEKEMLALAVLVRSPRWLDPRQQSHNIERSIANIAERLYTAKLTMMQQEDISEQQLSLLISDEQFNVQHFIEYANTQSQSYSHESNTIHTTIDSEMQQKIQRILDSRLDWLRKYNVHNGAVLVVDHETNEILSWVVGYAGKENKKFNQINSVVVERQPGSTLKPLLYSSALAKGWTAATMLNDSPLEESVGLGMHTYHNYSRTHYGLISLREALGNSLNIPAVRAVQYVGTENFLSYLSRMGIQSISGHPNVYGDGIALGNGELTLYELVQAYTVLARMGDYKPLTFIEGEYLSNRSYRVVSEDVASIIGDIMSDPAAREKEFGWDSVLNFPHQTAVKTGTSSDYRDAWAIGYNDKFTVGVWLGNLDYIEMNKVTGSTGPAMALRTIFNELNRDREVKPLHFSDYLVKQRVCIETGEAVSESCVSRDEWFVAGTHARNNKNAITEDIRIRKPSKGLMMAMDPRIPDEYEYFEFMLNENNNIQRVNWFVNDKLAGTTDTNIFHWKLAKGSFKSRAEVWLKGRINPVITKTVTYQVN